MRIFVGTAFLVVSLCSLAASDQHRGPANPAAVGPKVGERVPDFTLSDQHGRYVSLASVLGPNGTMLVFLRSADW